MFYAKSTNGFYDPAIHGANMPGDVVQITAAEHAALMKGQISGKIIAADNNGKPVLTDPAPVPLYPKLADAQSAMAKWIDHFLAKITGPVPQYERESWPAKAEAARAVNAGAARPDQTAMIAGEALTSGRTEEEVTAKIIAKADVFEAVISRTTGLRVKLDDQLEAESDPYMYEAILEAGKSQALSLASEIGVEFA